MGAADPFLMGPDYAPAPGIRRFLSGTPAVVGMLALSDMVDAIDEVGMDAVRDEVGGADVVRRRARGRLLAPLGVSRRRRATRSSAAGTSR